MLFHYSHDSPARRSRRNTPSLAPLSLLAAAAATRRQFRSLLLPCSIALAHAYLCNARASLPSLPANLSESVSQIIMRSNSTDMNMEFSCPPPKSPRALRACTAGAVARQTPSCNFEPPRAITITQHRNPHAPFSHGLRTARSSSGAPAPPPTPRRSSSRPLLRAAASPPCSPLVLGG